MITLNTAQEMRKYLGDDDGFYTGWTDRCINDLRTLFMKPDIQAVMEVVGTDGSIIDHFDERTLNPGHTTEGGWFVLEEARHRDNDPELIKVGCDMIDWGIRPRLGQGKRRHAVLHGRVQQARPGILAQHEVLVAA